MTPREEWQAWKNASDKLLESDLFKAYENAQKAFWESKEFKEYVELEEVVIDRGGRQYLEQDNHDPEQLCYGTPDYLRFINADNCEMPSYMRWLEEQEQILNGGKI